MGKQDWIKILVIYVVVAVITAIITEHVKRMWFKDGQQGACCPCQLQTQSPTQ